MESEKYRSAYLLEVTRDKVEYDLIFNEEGMLLDKQTVQTGK
jgi:hypothetical protein